MNSDTDCRTAAARRADVRMLAYELCLPRNEFNWLLRMTVATIPAALAVMGFEHLPMTVLLCLVLVSIVALPVLVFQRANERMLSASQGAKLAPVLKNVDGCVQEQVADVFLCEEYLRDAGFTDDEMRCARRAGEAVHAAVHDTVRDGTHEFAHEHEDERLLWAMQAAVPTLHDILPWPDAPDTAGEGMEKFMVYRQDTHGSKTLVRSGMGQGDAEMLVSRMEAGGHHQAYFLTPYRTGTLHDTLLVQDVMP